MRQPIKLIVKKGKIRRDGTTLIFLQYCHSADKRVLVGTGVAIPPQYWNKKTQRISKDLPPQFGAVDILEAQLTYKLRKAEDMITHAIRKKSICPVQFLKDNFQRSDGWQLEQMQDEKKTLDIYDHIDRYAESKENSVKQCTISVIKVMKLHLKSFEVFRKQPITFDSFDIEFYEEFVKFLTYDIVLMRRKETVRGLKINTIGKTIKHLKAFLTDRMSRKLIPFCNLSAYKVMEEDVDAIYLNWEELSTIYKLDLSGNVKLEQTRDLFVLGCLTGFRFSDYSDIKPDEIRDGMLFIKQTKTNSIVVVPLRTDARKILVEKYGMQMPQISNPEFNSHIKEVCRLGGLTDKIKISHKRGNRIIEETRPKYAWVVSHTCRRSFCTNEFLAGTPIHLIMAISGHKTEKAFRKYIKADQLQKAQMIKKLWEARPNL